MALRLSITGGDVADSGNRSRWTFGVNGGRIGRAVDNDWVIVDPERFISAHHAEIEHRAGEWWVCDNSTNGTFVNGSTRPLGRGGRHRLSHGDRLRMGSLDILAEISGGNDFVASDEDFDLSETALDASFEVRSLLSTDPKSGRAGPADVYGQPLPAPGAAPDHADARKAAVVKAVPLPPKAAPAARQQQQPAAPAASPEARKAAAAEPEIWPGLLAFCQGAGIDPHSLPPGSRAAVLREAGLALRETMLGLMELSRSRAEFTREVGISGGGRQRDATSPLLQVRAVEDALVQLLAGSSPQTMHAVDEVRTQFVKARHHQQAMLVALREALTNLLGNLDPAELEEQFGGATRGPVSAEAQARYWLLYRELFRALTTAGDTGLPQAFQEEFARAYQALAAVGLRMTSKVEDST